MPTRLDWVDLLNEETTWLNRSDLGAWLQSVLQAPVTVSDEVASDFDALFAYMRAQLAHLHFGEAVDTGWLDAQLKNIEVGFQVGDSTILPSFGARLRGKGISAQIRAIRETAMLQFAEFLGRAIDGGQLPAVARCEGLYRNSAGQTISPVRSLPAEVEKKWRREIALLSAHGLEESGDIQRCADFFVPTPKARFCSDACRFATFQIAKQIENPDYLADKQRRYRNRQENSSKKRR